MLDKLQNWLSQGVKVVKESPIGKLIDSTLDSTLAKVKDYAEADEKKVMTKEDFEVSCLILAAAVIKADESGTKFELDYMRSFLKNTFDEQHIEARIFLLEGMTKKQYDLSEVCHQIAKHTQAPERNQIVHFLLELADADASIHTKEMIVILQVAHHLGIGGKEFAAIKAMHQQKGKKGNATQTAQPIEDAVVVNTPAEEKALTTTPPPVLDGSAKLVAAATPDLPNCYLILEVAADAPDDVLEASYKRLIERYAPEQVAHLGEIVANAAANKLAQVHEAYKIIKTARS
jgi:DnaJ like chaperone protein